MVRAGALSYVIVVSLVIASILGSLIALSYFSRITFIDLQIQNKLIINANSGFNILLASPEIEELELDLFEEETDSVLLKTQPWGIFDIGISIAHHKNKHFSKTALLGYPPDMNNEMALYLADLNRPLSLAGKTNISGNAYLPEAGVKRAYIERQNFVGNRLINGKQLRSARNLPELNQKHLSYIDDQFRYNDEFDDSVNDSIINTFDKPTIHINRDGNLRGYYKGNVIIHSANKLLVTNECQLEGIQIYSTEIIIENNFRGSAQFIATENIVVEDAVRLNYPSALVLLINDSDETKKNEIVLNNSSYVNGVVIINREENKRSLPKLLIHQNAIVHGEVYVKGFSEIHGAIHGSIYTEKFYLKTPSSIYENHLLNAEIDYYKRNKIFVGSNILEKSSSRKVMQWLN